MELRLPILVVFNRTDMAEKEGLRCSSSLLSRRLGLPVIAASAAAHNVKQEILSACCSLAAHSASGRGPALPTGGDYALEAAARYDWAEKLTRECSLELPPAKNSPTRFSERLDGILLSKYWGYPILLLILCMVFFPVSYTHLFQKSICSLPYFRKNFVSAREETCKREERGRMRCV